MSNNNSLYIHDILVIVLATYGFIHFKPSTITSEEEITIQRNIPLGT